jgi:hypothetical protein
MHGHGEVILYASRYTMSRYTMPFLKSSNG